MYNARTAYATSSGGFSLKDIDRESFDRMPMIEHE